MCDGWLGRLRHLSRFRADAKANATQARGNTKRVMVRELKRAWSLDESIPAHKKHREGHRFRHVCVAERTPKIKQEIITHAYWNTEGYKGHAQLLRLRAVDPPVDSRHPIRFHPKAFEAAAGHVAMGVAEASAKAKPIPVVRSNSHFRRFTCFWIMGVVRMEIEIYCDCDHLALP